MRAAAMLFSVSVVVAAAGPAVAAATGDPAKGAALAQQWCSRCHNVQPGGAMKQQPPAFAAIAAYRSPGYIRTNIINPHSNMPEIATAAGLNVDDLVAYITSLERGCP